MIASRIKQMELFARQARDEGDPEAAVQAWQAIDELLRYLADGLDAQFHGAAWPPAEDGAGRSTG